MATTGQDTQPRSTGVGGSAVYDFYAEDCPQSIAAGAIYRAGILPFEYRPQKSDDVQLPAGTRSMTKTSPWLNGYPNTVTHGSYQ